MVINTDLEVYNCSKTFGNPSDVTFIVTCLLTVIAKDIEVSNPNTHPTNTCLLSFFGILLSFITGITRIYNVHATFDQILLGWELGIVIGLILHYCIRNQFIKHVDELLESTLLRYKLYDQLVISTALFMVFYGMLISAYQYQKLVFNEPQAWQTNFTRICGNQKVNRWDMAAQDLMNGSMLALAYGSYLGILFYSQFLGYNISKSEISVPSTIRVVISSFLVMIFVVPIGLLPNISDFRLAATFYYLIPSFAFGFVVFGVMDKIYSLRLKSLFEHHIQKYDLVLRNQQKQQQGQVQLQESLQVELIQLVILK
ncbi:pap2 superfamily phosphatase [Stylonychia lemnae]|uniref:Pap2 superfamily phosphatase n=1 Tax=Stylonychia lemnae TaxID=5949 RepID=A0A078AM02_STYLE|nr:pap2 superfamily phosphatase [Stylonychia lemnae]|eukprot:CDW83395.1 pap2 superfamily phosphatase [Stylonychia lemnae]